MSEVKRYHWAGDHSDGIGYGCMYDSVESGTKEMVGAEGFNRVTAERDAMQQRLTAADERADVLEGLLREVVALDPRGEFLGWQLDGKIDAALKPAEGGGDA